MNYDRLKTFIVVSEKKSFSEAAKILHVTQPTITGQIKALEEEMETILFERTTKYVKMTESAEILLTYAKEIVRLGEEAQTEIMNIGNSLHGHLKIGCSLTIGTYILPKILKHLQNTFPHIKMTVNITNSASIISGIKETLFDLGLVEIPLKDGSVEMLPFLKDELVLIAAPEYFPEDTSIITPTKLKTLPLILREEGSGTRDAVIMHLKKAGIAFEDLQISMELNSTDAIKASVEAGLGVSIISCNAIRKEKKLNLLKEYKISEVSLQREFFVAYRKQQVLKTAEKIFVRELSRIDSN